ncbi:MAG: type I methionyl aminopeptidase [Nitrospirae bacterium]|nr:type I methionyl aminopeptidase [Nitrospirota bacterium]
MIILKTPEEMDKMARACRIVGEVLEDMRAFVKPGVSTKDMEKRAEEKISARGGTAAFKGYRGYPASICTSVNNQVIHGIPSHMRLKDGDIVSVDVGVYIDGFYGDGAVTLPVGEISPLAGKLLRVTEEALYKGIDMATIRHRVSDISSAIQNHVEANGFSVVRAFVGHGIGMSLHEDPQIPNFGVSGQGPRLKEGMTIAIEPMVNARGYEVSILEDGWTAVTVDGGLSAHFEHTIGITDGDAIILTKLT